MGGAARATPRQDKREVIPYTGAPKGVCPEGSLSHQGVTPTIPTGSLATPTYKMIFVRKSGFYG